MTVRSLSWMLLISAACLVLACDDETDNGPTTTASGSGGGSGGQAGAGGGGSGGSGGSGGGGGAEPALADTLARYLTGRFDSEEQSLANPQYYAVQLYICPVDAPEIGERVLYVEQAIMTSLSAPYRQRLYAVEPGADPSSQGVSNVYELTDPAGFIGQCDLAELRTVTAAEAIERAGCAVLLDWDAGQQIFTGGTAGTGCESTLNGASYATSEVTLEATRILSWDRGYDAQDQQVWGAVAGPYEFIRRTPLPEE